MFKVSLKIDFPLHFEKHFITCRRKNAKKKIILENLQLSLKIRIYKISSKYSPLFWKPIPLVLQNPNATSIVPLSTKINTKT